MFGATPSPTSFSSGLEAVPIQWRCRNSVHLLHSGLGESADCVAAATGVLATGVGAGVIAAAAGLATTVGLATELGLPTAAGAASNRLLAMGISKTNEQTQ